MAGKVDDPYVSVLDKFRDNMAEVKSLLKIGTEISEIAIAYLLDIYNELESLSGHLPLKNKIMRSVSVMDKLKNSPVHEQHNAQIYNPLLVSIVSNFESFLNDMVRAIGSNNPEIIEWPEKTNIYLDTNLLGTKTRSLGDLILAGVQKKGITFQDLQSTRKFFKEYLKINIEISKENEESIIMAHAVRHIIVHAYSEVSPQFIQQIRNTKYGRQFKEGNRIIVSEDTFKKYYQTLLNTADSITDEVSKKVLTEGLMSDFRKKITEKSDRYAQKSN